MGRVWCQSRWPHRWPCRRRYDQGCRTACGSARSQGGCFGHGEARSKPARCSARRRVRHGIRAGSFGQRHPPGPRQASHGTGARRSSAGVRTRMVVTAAGRQVCAPGSPAHFGAVHPHRSAPTRQDHQHRLARGRRRSMQGLVAGTNEAPAIAPGRPWQEPCSHVPAPRSLRPRAGTQRGQKSASERPVQPVWARTTIPELAATAIVVSRMVGAHALRTGHRPAPGPPPISSIGAAIPVSVLSSPDIAKSALRR